MSLPRRVYLASPFSGDRDANEFYAEDAMRDSLKRGEAPFVPHLHYPIVLDDDEPLEREAGMRAGTAWLLVSDVVVAYIDRGVSRGMQAEIDTALAHGVEVEWRRIL